MLKQFYDSKVAVDVRVPCANVPKVHLWRLPDMLSPPPKHNEGTGKSILLWPLFHIDRYDGDDFNHNTLVHHGLRGAIWSRNSFMRHTDALARGVEMKFYLEERCLPALKPILDANFVDVDRDVLLFDGSHMDGKPVTHLGKKLSLFYDERLCGYDWVCPADFDIFFASIGGVEKKYPLFQKLEERAPMLGTISGQNLTDVVPENDEFFTIRDDFRTVHDTCWHHFLLPNATADEQAVEWGSRVRTLLQDDAIVEQFTTRTHRIPYISGSLYLYPAKHLFDTDVDRCEWIERAGRELQDDEAVFSLYATQWETFSLSHELRLPYVGGIEWMRYQREFARGMSDGFYFLHLGDLWHEHVWRLESGIPLLPDASVEAIREV